MNSLLEHLFLVDGGWSGWSGFGTCSETCGDGTKERIRSCTNPAQAFEGADCIGDPTDTENCKIKECRGQYNLVFIKS